MKRLKLVNRVFLAAAAFFIVMPGYSHAEDGMVELSGCVYNKNTGKKVNIPFFVEYMTKDGLGGGVAGDNGCYEGMHINTTGLVEWDYIEVTAKKKGKYYRQRYPLSLYSGAREWLGMPPGEVKYDFYLDIID